MTQPTTTCSAVEHDGRVSTNAVGVGASIRGRNGVSCVSIQLAVAGGFARPHCGGQAIEPGSTVQTDGLQAYRKLHGYTHERRVQRHQSEDAAHLLPRAHRVISLLKRWLLETHQGAIAADYLQDYLDGFTFRFNRRNSASPGKPFYRLAQQAVQVTPTTYEALGHHKL